MTVQSQILRCMNNRLRNNEEAGKLADRKKTFVTAQLQRVANTRTQPSMQSQSEPKLSLMEPASDEIHETRRGLQSRRHGIFRQQRSSTSSFDDAELEDMLVLKRANPVYDSDDEDECHGSPLKRQKSMGFEDEGESVSSISWNEQLLEDEIRGFSLDSPKASGSAIGAH